MLRRHSPGPWYVYRDAVHPNLDGKSPHETNADTIICEPLGPDSVANARLIAAAPEMLSCLRELLALHEAHHNHPAHAAARAAIKKAAPDQFPINKPSHCSGRDKPGQEGAKSNHDQ